MTKTTNVRFSKLRHLLLDLGFAETTTETYRRFEHPVSGAVFLFRPYDLKDNVTVDDLASTRTHLDWRGLLPSNAFDDSLTKAPA
jgi:hypothetical protein